MKRWLAAAALLLLTGCAATEDGTAERILQQYENMKACSMEAVVRCEYESESREYTLRCTYDAEGVSEVTILEPTGLQGITVVREGEACRVIYKDLVLDASALGKGRLSPADILPRAMDAVKRGWLLEENAEQENEDFLRRMVFETEENGAKQYWTVYFDEKTGVPRYAEVSEDYQLFFTMEFTKFSFDDIMMQGEH